jgi:hypothetical protein
MAEDLDGLSVITKLIKTKLDLIKTTDAQFLDSVPLAQLNGAMAATKDYLVERKMKFGIITKYYERKTAEPTIPKTTMIITTGPPKMNYRLPKLQI